MPLHGLKILDFTTLLPGPMATLNLADLGANVLRVESPSKPDLVRFIPPFVDSGGKISCAHAYLNRNKSSITLDLKKNEAVRIVERLICEAGFDVLVEQSRPGVMDRMGLSFDRLKAIKPDLIYCSITGYGQTGPLRSRAGHDINYLSLSGVMSYSGTKDSGPLLSGIQIADMAGAHNAVAGILSSVIRRMKTGKGQHIDISITECMFQYNAISGAGSLNGGFDPGFETEVLGGNSLYGFYETLDGRHLSFGGLEPQFSAVFLKAIGLPELVPGGVFQFECFEESKKLVKDRIMSQPLEYWIELFSGLDACVEPVLSVSEAASSEHSKQRGVAVTVPCENATPQRQFACPIRFSECAPSYDWAGCRMGRDNEKILGSLGFSGQDISKLREDGIVGS